MTVRIVRFIWVGGFDFSKIRQNASNFNIKRISLATTKHYPPNMHQRFLIVIAAVIGWTAAEAQTSTFRVDYILTGTDRTAVISVAEIRSMDGWAGRRTNMSRLPVDGNGQATMTTEKGDTIYRTSFSTLFQEWQNTEEATKVVRSFEHTVLFPMPDGKATITIRLSDSHGRTVAELSHRIDPKDILIRPVTPAGYEGYEPRYILRSGDPEKCIDVAIVAEGYTGSEMERFFSEAREAMESILRHEPFRSMKNRFNFVAVPAVSKSSDVSVPHLNQWHETALHSSFDTFYMERYLTTTHIRDMHDILSAVPYEHVIILANSATYGGGGIYNSYTIATTRGRDWAQVIPHEFGHSFAGLGDEYYYDDMYTPYYHPDFEPWEQNITTKCNFSSKWEDMIGKTPGVGLYEGGGYQSKGVWRPCEDCRMKTNKAKDFCPVCQRAIERMIRFYTE